MDIQPGISAVKASKGQAIDLVTNQALCQDQRCDKG